MKGTSVTHPDYLQAITAASTWLADPQAVILDTETTDLNGYLVQIAITSITGEVLLDQIVRPQAWINPKAAAIHGLTEDKLLTAPTFGDLADQIIDLIKDRRVIIYNVGFDRNILRNELIRWYTGLWNRGLDLVSSTIDRTLAREWATSQADALLDRSTFCCAMDAYSTYVGEWNEYYGNYRWQKLPSGDHSALGDCRATLKVLQTMAKALEAHETTTETPRPRP
jgi:DNA polymerase III subunit epsilon